MVTCKFENGNEAQLRHTVVDIIAIKDSSIILCKRARTLDSPGKWCLPSGYMEKDETSKEATLRELKEETGYSGEVEKLLLVNDNPKRKNEFYQNVALVYLVTVGEKVGPHDKESSDVKWFTLDKLPPEEEFAFDHFEIIQNYLKTEK